MSRNAFIAINNKSWIDKPIGNALKDGYRSVDVQCLSDLINEFNSEGLPEPCQRLCCAKLDSFKED